MFDWRLHHLIAPQRNTPFTKSVRISSWGGVVVSLYTELTKGDAAIELGSLVLGDPGMAKAR